MAFHTKTSTKFSLSPRRAFQAFCFTATILCSSAQGFAALATPPYTDENLIEEAKNPAFNHVIDISMQRPNGLYICSAAKVHIPGLGIPLYLTAAHCLKNVVSVKDNQGRMASAYLQYYRYPLESYSYELGIGNDVAFFVVPEDKEDNGYPLYTGNFKELSDHSLISVGYGTMADDSSPKQAFYAGPLSVNLNGAMLGQKTSFTNCDLFCSDYRSGKSTGGDSGGPLLAKHNDGTYAVAAVLVRSNDISSQWDVLDPDFIKTAADIFGRDHKVPHNGTLIDRTEEGATKMLENPREVDQIIALCENRNNWELFHPYIDSIRKMALSGKAHASYALGRLYQKKKDHQAAIQWYTKAAEGNHFEAQSRLNSYLVFNKINDMVQNHILPLAWTGLESTFASFISCLLNKKGFNGQKSFSHPLFFPLTMGAFSALYLKRVLSSLT